VLHITSAHCDDDVITSLCAGVLNALALHGCSTVEAALPEDARVVLVVAATPPSSSTCWRSSPRRGWPRSTPPVSTSSTATGPATSANSTLLGMDGHLELTGPLREAMFGVNTRPRRKDTTEVFWNLAVACRNALARLEAGQVSHPIADTKHHGHPQ
jgi:Poly-gamma-glutamate hydrolase